MAVARPIAYDRAVNFLSHGRVLGDGLPALAHVGAALPDLWPMLPVRPLPLVVLRRLRAADDADAAALAWGIGHHMHADAAFHGHPAFAARVRVAVEHLAPILGAARHQALAGHVLVEMLLDRWIIERDGGVVDRYYGRFGSDACGRASALSSTDDAGREQMAACLERFTTVRFLADYRCGHGLARRFTGALRRTGLAADVDVDLAALAPVLLHLHALLAPGSGALLAEVQVMAEASLARSGFTPPVPHGEPLASASRRAGAGPSAVAPPTSSR